ncbi:MAG: DUF427 domain-containing protein [Rhodospirillales bacterium]|nr:DUF427 domain-containing protein [Rhodospirillales bacterium]
MMEAANRAVADMFRFIANEDFACEFVLSPRRVRVKVGEVCLADTVRAMLYRERGRVPVYYFPKADIRMDLLESGNHESQCPYRGRAEFWDLKTGGGMRENILWSYPEPCAELASMADYCAFTWGQVDHWFEEEDEIFIHARDPFKRIDVVASSRPVEVRLGGVTVAGSTRALFLFETNLLVRYYLPMEDVRMDLFAPSDSRTSCPYKGDAIYWSANIGGESFPDIVWSYPEPIPECPRIKGYLSFYNEKVDAILVDGEETPKVRAFISW